MVKRKNGDSGEDSNTEHSAQDSAIDTRVPKRIKKNTVEELNALDKEEFRERMLDNDLLGFDEENTTLELHFAKALPASDFDACFDLIETTSRHDYEPSSFGWHPKRKRREMREKEMRYLLIKDDKQQFQGFMSFMLTYDSTPVVPVLYIYEIHLTQGVRGKGLGQHLMKLAEDIARRAGMDKVMLTCFLSNTKAHTFYQRLGYDMDESSPEDRKTRNKTSKVDYVIMSKDFRRQDTTANTSTEVMRDEYTDEIESTEANGVTRLDECETALRAWTHEHRAKEVLNAGLGASASAQRELSLHNHAAATEHRETLQQQHRFLETRYEAARDLTEILREQMYHLKSQIADVNRVADIMNGQSPTPLQPTLIRHPSSSSEQEPFDMEKSTEQIYSAFFTLMRKAEEIDNRLDDVANREEAASVLEDNLNDREDELDEWEEDLHEREKALAEREERLMRAQGRLGRRAQRRTVNPEEDRPVMREVLWKHGPPPPIVKVSDWLRRSEDFAVEPDEES